ncbi:MAG: hypothetical protein M0Q13_05705 [Methanothrix sp.]|jgi:two-component system CheB/CheR fusion protein|nr:hypothetical protein [Methanothrix sp.]
MPEKSFPIIGVGASVGGRAAFEAFFSCMQDDIDLAQFVYVATHGLQSALQNIK